MIRNLILAMTATTVMLASAPVLAVDLVGTLNAALDNDPILRAAAYRRDASQVNRQLALANFLPNLSGSASRSQGDSETQIAGELISENDTDTENFGLNLRQSLYSQANIEQAQRAASVSEQADAGYGIAYQDFLLRLAEAYFNVLTSEDSVRLAEAEAEALKRQYEQADQRFEVGLSAATDVLDAQASYDNAQARVILARNALEDAREAIRAITGQSFSSFEPLEEELPLERPLPESPADWVQFALEYRPELQRSRHSAEIAEEDVDLARSGYYPSLDLVASRSRFINNEFLLRNDQQQPIGTVELQSDDTSIGLQLSVPIFNGGRTTFQTRQAGYLMRAAYQDLENEQRQAVRLTENAYRDVIAGIQEVEAFRRSLTSAESALEATNSGFSVGTRTIVDVLISEQRFYQAQRDYSRARHDYILDHLRLRRAAGLLTADDLGTVNELLQ